MTTDGLINFDLPKNKSSIIKVIGVGGGGSNAVNYMYSLGIDGVDFLVCNTDHQALDLSPIPNKIQLGVELTEGLGAGSKPETGKQAAEESIEQIREILSTNTKMVFITAGMGGGTGTGAAPIIAQTAKEMGILTVGIVTLPFGFEGKVRRRNAEIGITELKNSVDTLLIICNDRLRQMYGNLSLSTAFSKADDVLATAAKGIAEIVTSPGFINVDFKDVETTMSNGGTAIMGYATASGEGRALKAIQEALSCPLLNDNSIKGSKQILVNISTSRGEFEASMDEIADITDYIFEEAGEPENVIPGVVFDDSLGDSISVIVIATHLTEKTIEEEMIRPTEKKIHTLADDTLQNTRIETKVEVKEEIKDEEGEMFIIRKETLTPSPIAQQASVSQNNAQVDASRKLSIGKTVVPSAQDIQRAMEKNEAEMQEQKFIIQEPFVIESVTEEPVVVAEKTESVKSEKSEVTTNLHPQEAARLGNDRISKLKSLSSRPSLNYNLDNPDELRKIEDVPAYIRNNVSLNKVANSSISEVSKYTLSEGEEGLFGLKENNPYFNPKVD